MTETHRGFLTLPSQSSKPKYAALPWLDEEEADLYHLACIHGRNATKLREQMKALGWDRTEQAIHNRLQRAFPKSKGFSIPRKAIVMPSEVEILALHKPWRK